MTGNVYVFDEQAHHVQVYDSEGVYVETLGGRGEGPGEFSRAEAVALLPDGRLVVRDPGNMRVQVFGPGPGGAGRMGIQSRQPRFHGSAVCRRARPHVCGSP